MPSFLKSVILRKFNTITLIALLGSVMLGVAIVVLDRRLCMSESCQRVAVRIRSRLDTDVDPCDDFYQFACGRLLASDSLPDKQHSILLSEAQRLQEDKVRSLMQGDESTVSEVGKKVFAFIKMCNEHGILHQAAKELPQIRTDAGLFPSVAGDKFDETSWSLLDVSAKLRKIGLDYNSLFDLDVYYNPINPHELILCLRNPLDLKYSLLECDQKCESDYVQQYLSTVEAFDGHIKSGFKDALEVMNFEKGLVNNAIKYKNQRDSLRFEESVVAVSVITERYGFLDWEKYISAILGSGHKTISNNTLVLVFNAGYLDQLSKTISQTPPRILANYQMWFALRPITDRSCSAWVEDALPVPLQKTYLETFGSSRRKAFVFEMIHIMLNELKESIGLLDWLDDDAKLQSYNQIDEILFRLVSSDSLDAHEYWMYYNNVDITGNFTFLLNFYKNWWDKKFNLLLTGVDRNSWDMVLLVFEKKLYSVNVIQTPADNSLTILDGFLQQPVHDEDWPGYLNYGRLGTSIAHVITHSLDYRGNHFDEHGKPRDWWNEESKRKFKVKEECFVHQLNRLKEFNEKEDYLQVAESIADTGGLKLGFEAYRKFEDSLAFQDLMLPGTSYTQEQMFFISYAQLRCSRNLDPVFMIDDFLPSQFRVSSSIQNNVLFGEVFGCNKGTRMNPTEKCEVWM